MNDIAKYIYVDDKEHIEKIKRGLAKKEEKFGKPYCPCVTKLLHSEDTICPCKEYRNTGNCHCKMYKE